MQIDPVVEARRFRQPVTVLLLGLLLVGCQPPESKDNPQGEFTIDTAECIAPADPGGGYDLTCRSAARVLTELGLVERNMNVLNMPGGGGGVAYAHAITQRRDDDALLLATSLSAVLQIAQGRFSTFDRNDVRWLAAIAADYGAIIVTEDSPFESLDDLVTAWRQDSSSVKIGGGSAIGGQDHMKMIRLAQEASGTSPEDVRYVPFAGGGEAVTSLLGGFVDVMSGDVAEMSAHLDGGNVRLLAVLAPERLTGDLANIPTAQEQGYDVEWTIFRGFYMPPGVSDRAYQGWLDALTELESSDEWAEVRAQNNLQPFFLGGAEFETYVREQEQRMKQLSQDVGLLEPSGSNSTE